MRTVVSVVDLARVLLDRALGHRGAEAEVAARSCARARGSAASGSPSRTPAPTRSNLKTRAEKIDGGWRINGGKMWISLGNYAKLAMIFAQTDP